MNRRHASLFLIPVFLVSSAVLTAGVTGKISGTVTDASTGEGLMGVNVILQNTAQGAATDVEGNYTILNVYGGKYTLVATMIGYKKVEIVNVTVLADRTTLVDIRMEQTAIEGEEVTIVATRPPIVRDETATTSTVLAEEIENMPVNSYVEVLDNVAGVVENSNGGGDDGIHIRGGRSNEIAYMVDGFFVEDAIYGGMGTDVSRAGISELSVITGAFNAEYGEAMSGVVNILTKEGGPELAGHLRVTTDQTGLYEETERPLSDWNTRRLEGSLGGPIPLPFLRPNALTFFLSGDRSTTETYLGRTQHNRAVFKDLNNNRVYEPHEPFNDVNENSQWDPGESFTDLNGNGDYDDTYEYILNDQYDLDADGDTDELLVAGHIHKNATFENQTRINAKLAFRPGANVKITAGGIFNRVYERNYSLSFKLYQQNTAPLWRESDLFYVSLNHNLSPRTFYNVKWSRFDRRSWEGLEEFMREKKKLFGTERDLWNVTDVQRIHRLETGQYIWNPYEPYFDANGNGVFDDGEPFSDVDGDGTWTPYVFDTGSDGVHAESFTDANGNGTWDPDESFVDSNGDGIWNGPDEGEWDGLPTAGEPGVVDLWWSYYAEPFLDTPDGIYRDGSYDILVYDADQDGVYDPDDGDYFIDISGDGVWREGEPFVDMDGDGQYDYGITPPLRATAFEGESNYEFLGTFSVYDLNGNFVRETTSQDNYFERYLSSSETVEGSFTSQVTNHHQIKFGGEYKTLLLEDFRNYGMGGGIWGITADPSFVSWKYEPIQGSLYIQDKIEFRDWVINLGLRWDYLDPKSEYADPTKKIAYLDPFGNFTSANAQAEPFHDEGNGRWDPGEYFLDENGNGSYDTGEIFTDRGNGIWDEGEFFVDDNGDGTWTGAVERYGYFDEEGNFVEPPRATRKTQLSPRLGIGYPITDRIAFHFSYGHFFQYPEYDKMFRLANLANPTIFGNSLYPFPYSLADFYIPPVGNPNLKPETTVAYEFGIRWQISNDFLLNSTVFYKDIYDYISATIFLADPTDYAVFENIDYGNSRGIEFNLRKLFSRNYSFSITYTFSKAMANAANEYTHWNEAYLASVYGTFPSLKTITMPWDQPHTLNFSFDYRDPIRRWGLNLVGNIGSGLPYTPSDARGRPLSESNSGRMPSTAVVDMKAYKDFRFKRLPFATRLFADVTNLLNKKNVLNVFDNSGKPDESLNPNNSIEWVDRPYYFGPPRHIEIGVNLLFD